MTSHRLRTGAVGGRVLPAWVVLVVAGGAGVVLGGVDLMAQLVLPYPWANLANSSAVWALGAFGVGWWVRRGPVRCAVAGVVLLVVAVEAYFAASVLALGNDPIRLVSSATLLWLAFGVLAGCVFGAAGHLRAVRRTLLAAIGAALPAAVLLAEAALLGARAPGRWDDGTQTAVIQVALALLVAALVGRGIRGKLLAVALALPLAGLGWLAFRAGGFA